ncbi:type II toxin-antitoxin system RelE/ParE family toxin [Sphingomonas sp. UYEF23]|uniref:type II toxin-antitoxin system RelE/ParE family toxin n=1 Tax=Sphingomonas sp. UYEF23 TaxID=1756408 RepID=UPI003394729D
MDDEIMEIDFRGGSLDDLRDFPGEARKEAGYQLDKVQHGEEPSDWKPFSTVGKGVREIRISEDGDAFRVMYVAKFENTVHVLHCFQKKMVKTSKPDIEIATKRYKALLKELGQ